MHRILTLLIAAATALCASAQTTQRFDATKANDYGLVYSLPLTQLDVTIEAKITRTEPGEFAQYAVKYLNAQPILEPGVKVEVSRAAITTSGVANPSQRYMITLKGGQAPFIILAEDGRPLAINTDNVADEAFSRPDWQSQPASPTPLQTAAASQVITQEMLQSHSSAMRAQLAAEQIYQLRQTRTDLVTGQAEQMPGDGKALQLMLDNIDAREAALTAMFLGTTSVTTEVRTVSLVPEDDLTDYIIARVSATEGIVAPSNLAGVPVYLSLNVTQRGQMPVNDKGDYIPFPKGGVAYCIPGEAAAKLTCEGRTLAQATVPMAQFGVVYGMNPSNFTDKKEPIYLLFDPATGAAARVGSAR